MGVYMPDLFSSGTISNEESVMKETIACTLSFNGQRCTALKILFVLNNEAINFAEMLSRKVENLTFGLPWEATSGKYSQITLLCTKQIMC